MLPRASGKAVANGYGFLLSKMAHAIWHDTILGPITAANDISASRTRHRNRSLSRIVQALKKRATIGRDDGFSARFTRAVRIVPTEKIVFAVGMDPLHVFIDLVAGDHDDHTGTIFPPRCFEYIEATYTIGLYGFVGLVKRAANNRLGREVEDEVGLIGLQHGLYVRQRLYIATDISE